MLGMDFIVSYQLHKNIKNKNIKRYTKDYEFKCKCDYECEIIKEETQVRENPNKTCEKCGQDPYFCQCNEINKLIILKNFNPEKDIY